MKLTFHDQLGLNFEPVPPCPSLEQPPRRRNRRLGIVGRLIWRPLMHAIANRRKIRNLQSEFRNSPEPGDLIRYTQFFS